MAATTHSTPLLALDAVVLDTETTGLDPRTARLLQIGAVRISGGNVRDGEHFSRLARPDVPIPAASSAIHRITAETVSNAPPFADIASELERFVGPSLIIGHHIAYDLAVLEREYALLGRPWVTPPSLDTQVLAQIAIPSLADRSLERLGEWLDVPMSGRHSALGDAIIAANIFTRLVPLLRERGIRTLAEAQAAAHTIIEGEARARNRLSADGIGPQLTAVRSLARIDSFPYRHRIRDVMSTPPIIVDATLSVAEAIRILLDKGISSIFVRDASDGMGIVTERDALRALHSGGENGLATPLGALMSRPLYTISEDAFVYRAIGRIERLGFRHLGVCDAQGNITGALTTRNLLRHRATTALVLGDEIDSATSPAELGRAWARVPLMARDLLEEDIDPRTVSAVISSEICALTKRAAQLAEQRLDERRQGPPPVPYGVLVLGSAGRGESLLAADQDNAIVYASGGEGGPEDRWFETMAVEMNEILHSVGVPLCKGGVMARNRQWRKSVADWTATIDGWVRRQNPQDLLNVDIFFDAILVHGDPALSEAIWNHAWIEGGRAPDFLKLMTEVARQRAPAFTLFGNFKLDGQRRIDVKRTALMPIFTGARVLAIRHDVRARSTPDRLSGVAAKGVGDPAEMDEIIAAHQTLLGALLAQQLIDSEQGVPLSPRIAPQRLSKAARADFREALHKVDTLLDLVGEGRL
jgi:DNA polymerase-3 subunit epsilon/CBS domain-containing protein